MADGKAHKWAEKDDILVCYLALHGEDRDINKMSVAEYMKSHSDSGKSPQGHIRAIKMRIQNCIAVFTNGARGLSHPSKQTRKVCAEWQGKSREEHRAKCLEIMGVSA